MNQRFQSKFNSRKKSQMTNNRENQIDNSQVDSDGFIEENFHETLVKIDGDF